MAKFLIGMTLGLVLSMSVSAHAQLSHWNVRGVVLHFKHRIHGDNCHQIIFEDGSGTVCTRSYRIRLDP